MGSFSKIQLVLGFETVENENLLMSEYFFSVLFFEGFFRLNEKIVQTKIKIISRKKKRKRRETRNEK